jgi:hypothetical protein
VVIQQVVLQHCGIEHRRDQMPDIVEESATVKTGGWEYVRCTVPSSSKRANSSSGVISGGGIRTTMRSGHPEGKACKPLVPRYHIR